MHFSEMTYFCGAGHKTLTVVSCECRTAVEERQFESICTRMLNAKKHVVSAKDWLVNLKSEKPKAVSCLFSHFPGAIKADVT